MKPNKVTFSNILRKAEQNNSERLVAKTRLAKRLAKKSRGASRKMAYHIKSKALG